jgi:hypothetical protein
LGTALVAGRKRVPIPATGMTAFRVARVLGVGMGASLGVPSHNVGSGVRG